MALFYGTAANAQATRTWVSGVGDDVNPCSRTAPCKTFAGAISKTAAGGEINCLDPGGFGAVTITKSMTINCEYTEGGVLAGGNGITVNDGATATPGTAVVHLRGLDIFGVNPPTHGVRFVSGAELHIEDSTIRRFNAANSQAVSFQPSGSAALFMTNVQMTGNGSGNSGGGILIQPTGTGTARAVLTNVRARGNGGAGLNVNTTSNTGTGVTVVVQDSEFSGSPTGIAISAPAGAAVAGVMFNNVISAINTNGLVANGPGVTARMGNSTITGNSTGLLIVNSASVLSYGNNRLDGNPTSGAANNGAFTGAIIPTR